MREILFRGKRVDNNEWVYGFLSKSRGNNHFLSLCIDHEENGVMLSSIVEPEAIGQYTGLTDKNGTKIFEGDVVKCISRFDAKDMVVIFEAAEFHLVDCQRYKNYTECCGYRYFGTLETEVIGNIYDNPELVEGLL